MLAVGSIRFVRVALSGVRLSGLLITAMWGYRFDGEYPYEGFDNSSISSGDFALMLYRMEHGGSHLK